MTEISIAQIIFIFIIMTIGSTLQGAVGYGLAMVVSPFLVMIEPYFIPGAMTIPATILVFLVIFRERDALDFWGLRWAIIGAAPGMLLGTYLLTRMPVDNFVMVFAVLILVAVGLSLTKINVEPSSGVLFIAGFISGLMGILSNMSGPAIALVFQRSSGPKLRATISGYFVMSIILAFINLIPAGRMGLRELRLSLYLIPPMFVGFFLSSYVKDFLDRGYTRIAVLVVSALSAILVLSSQIF
ncbi:MAG TPA: sulfite exporter TauE/SafE family protein [Anaerolineales bacterium]|nr:sulfite exporter TauE/SafE family protein [Anaerolineales bacterium]